MEEAQDRPHYIAVYRKRRRALISGEAPQGVNDERPMRAREWRASCSHPRVGRGGRMGESVC